MARRRGGAVRDIVAERSLVIDSPAAYLTAFELDAESRAGSDACGRTRVDELRVGDAAIPRYVNEFWTSEQRRGNPLHEISYRACYKAELPRFFIELLTAPGDLVYDPFMGRGTTLLEAALLGRRVAGNDINPLSRTLIEPRLEVPDLPEITERLDSIDLGSRIEADLDLSMFFSPATLRSILALRDYLRARREAGDEDAVDRWIRMVATNRLTGHSPGFFSVYSLPPNQAVSAENQRRINARRGQVPGDRDVRELIIRKSRSLQRALGPEARLRLRSAAADARYLNTDACDTPELASGSVDLVVTSPPFLDLVQYHKDNWLRCWFNSMDSAEIGRGITNTSSLDRWTEIMGRVLAELARVLRPGGWIAFEVGDVLAGRVMLDEHIAPAGMRAGLECRGIVVNAQLFTKTANVWGVRNNRRGTNTNRIVLLRKPRPAPGASPPRNRRRAC